MASVGSIIDKFLANPLAGLAPWIIYALVEGPGRLELAAAIAFGTALAVLLIGSARGSSPKLLEYTDVVFFGAIAIIVAVASTDTRDWLELWGGEVANIALVVIVVGSIVIRRPFTLAYAKQDTPQEYWHTPAFLRANYIISGVWGAAFVIEAAAGWYGDAVLRDSNNIWTGWVIQTIPLIIAAQFTLWYPEWLEKQSAVDAGESTEPPPPLTAFFAQITPLIAIVGVIVLFVGDAPLWIGIALTVIGSALTKFLQPDKQASPAAGT